MQEKRDARQNLTLLLVVSLLCGTALAQTHHHVAPPLIKGSEHPEQVSDQRAWLTTLLASTTIPSDSDKLKEAAAYNRKAAGLLIDGAALDDFRSRHDRFVAEYNKAVDGISDSTVVEDAQNVLYQHLDQLAIDMVGYVHRNHSPSEWAQINQRIQESKERIVFATKDVPEGAAPSLEPAIYHPGDARLVRAQYIYNEYNTAGYTQYASLYTDGVSWFSAVYAYGASNVQWPCTYTYTGPQGGWQWLPSGCIHPGPPVHTFYVTNQINGVGANDAVLGGYSASTYVNLSHVNQQPVGQNDGFETVWAGIKIFCPTAKWFFVGLAVAATNTRFGYELVKWDGTTLGSNPLVCGITNTCSNARPWAVDLDRAIALPINPWGSGSCPVAFTCYGVCVRPIFGYPWSCTDANAAYAFCKALPAVVDPPQQCTPHP